MFIAGQEQIFKYRRPILNAWVTLPWRPTPWSAVSPGSQPPPWTVLIVFGNYDRLEFTNNDQLIFCMDRKTGCTRAVQDVQYIATIAQSAGFTCRHKNDGIHEEKNSVHFCDFFSALVYIPPFQLHVAYLSFPCLFFTSYFLLQMKSASLPFLLPSGWGRRVLTFKCTAYTLCY